MSSLRQQRRKDVVEYQFKLTSSNCDLVMNEARAMALSLQTNPKQRITDLKKRYYNLFTISASLFRNVLETRTVDEGVLLKIKELQNAMDYEGLSHHDASVRFANYMNDIYIKPLI